MNPTDFHFWQKILTTIFCGGGDRPGASTQRPTGRNPHQLLICMGTCTYVSIGADIIGTVDPTRVLAQLVTGVGFIGAGGIMSKPGQESVVVGVTSAAIIWMLAAVGATIGLGRLDTAIALTLVAVGVLLGVELLESSFLKLRRGVHAKYRQVDDDSQEKRKGPLSS